MNQADKIYVAGHRGLVGSAIVRHLQAAGFENLLLRSHQEVDLTRQQEVEAFLMQEKPDYVVLAAAKVGGIQANNEYPADFIYTNLMIEANVIQAAFRAGVQHLLFLGSSCIYPKYAAQPMREDALLTDVLEPTNEPYAVAKIAGIKLCESYNRQHGTQYRAVMPTNLYGPHDNFHPQSSHVIPALLRKFHEAKMTQANSVSVWGTGQARREFLHVDDMAAACLFVMQLDALRYAQETQPMLSHLNVGTGEDIKIQTLAELVQKITGFSGEIIYDHSKPEGTPRKLMDVSRLHRLGWRASIGFEQGLNETYQWFVQHQQVD